MAQSAYPRDSADGIPFALPVNAAAREWARITGTPRPHRSTIIRWCTRGCRGVRLAGRMAGGGWVVTRDALREFHFQINQRPTADHLPIGGIPGRAAEVAQALVELDALTGGTHP